MADSSGLWLAERTLPLRWQISMWRAGAVALSALCSVAAVQAGSELGSGIDNDRLLPGLYPQEPAELPVEIDWSIGLRGTLTKATSGERFDVNLLPELTLTHEGSRSMLELTGSAEVTRPDEGNIDVTGLRLGARGGYALDSQTRLTATSNLSLTRALAGTPGIASNIVIAPQTFTGGASLGVSRQFGRFNVGVTGAVERNAYGPTTFIGGTSADNSERDVWSLDAGLRIGYQATPIFEVFGQAGLGRDLFDKPSSSLLVKTDATDTTLEVGLTGRWSDTLEATVSTGIGLRRFDAPGLDEVVSQLYDASVSFTPNETWRATAAFGTTVAPPGPNSGGTTRIQYDAKAEVNYRVNSWLALRTFADWTSASSVGIADTETGHGFGVGANYLVSTHTSLSADYGYSQSQSTADGFQDAHRVTVGVTLAR